MCIDIYIILQLSEYQQKLSEAESEVFQLRSQLASLGESREKLQQVIDECSSQERQSQNQIKLLQAQLDNKSERLSTAEDKIQVNAAHNIMIVLYCELGGSLCWLPTATLITSSIIGVA